VPSGEKGLFQKEEIQVLVDLGLTSLQARAYLALSSLRTATMKSISITSNIARQDIYRIMPMLQQLGLAEKIITTPCMYKATPLNDGINVLLLHKSIEYNQLQKRTEEMANNFQNAAASFRMPFQTDNSNFLIISERRLLVKTLDEKNQTVQKSLRVCGTWESARMVLFDAELDRFKKALKKGVKIKWITEDHEEDKATVKALQSFVKNPLFEIRYFAPPIPLQTAIYDEKEVVMCIATPPSTDVTSIWSDNPMFVRVALNYWEEVWNGSLREYHKHPATDVNRKMITQ
jgi:sugar-specific transcriptional regulator TrmB